MLSTGEFVNVGELRLYVRRICSEGPPLVLLHGLTDSGACWNRVAAHLTPEYEIVALDLRAHGLSDAPANGYAAGDHARDVIGIIEILGFESVTLIGHSLGADTAAQVALLRPELVRRLVLEDPPWNNDWLAADPKLDQKTRADWAFALNQQKELSVEQLLAQKRRLMPHWVEEELVPWVFAKLDVRVQALDYIQSERPSWQSTVRGLRCPTLLVTGDTERGALVSSATADEACSLLPELEVLHLAGAGHCVHRDQFDGYLFGLRRFLEET
jgi:pimeloyl-ACP methyl ester carboxylesterase